MRLTLVCRCSVFNAGSGGVQFCAVVKSNCQYIAEDQLINRPNRILYSNLK